MNTVTVTITINAQPPAPPRWLNDPGKELWFRDLAFRCGAASATTKAEKRFANQAAFLRMLNR